MENQPFSLQAPEAIAKKYGGNKQKIAQAAQNGLLDPTAAVMAGMFIDRMRSAQTTEQGPQPTVAQQVLSPQPAPPPAAPAGLGAIAPGAAPPMAPPMGGGAPPPMPMPQEAPPMTAADGGLMSSGGLNTLPVPNDMFDEPEGVSMADGGIVAFAGAGPVGDGDIYDPEQSVMERFFGHILHGGTPEQKAAARQKARDFLRQNAQNTMGEAGLSAGAPPPKAPNPNIAAFDEASYWSPSAKQVASQFFGGVPKPLAAAPPAPATLNRPAASTIDPAVAAALAARKGTVAPAAAATPPGLGYALAPAKTPADTGKSKTRTAAIKTLTGALAPEAAKSATNEFGIPTSVEGGIAAVKKSMEGIPTDALKAMQKEIADTPDRLKKQKQEDLWSSLAQIGFGMAATKSPSFLQAFGESAGAAMPGMQAALKERRAAERDATKQALELENLQYGRAADIVKSGTELGIKGLELKEAKFTRDQQHQIQLAQLALTASEGAANRGAAATNAALGQNTAADRLLEIYFQGLKKANPKVDDATLRMMAAQQIQKDAGLKTPQPEDILGKYGAGAGAGASTGKWGNASIVGQ